MKETIMNYLNDYLNYCKTNKSLNSRTLKTYRIYISQYIEFLNFDTNTPLEDIFKDSYQIYCDYLLSKNFRQSTLTIKITSIRLFLIYLESRGVISNISTLFYLDTIDNSKEDKTDYINTLKSISESDIKSLLISLFDTGNHFKYGSKKHQKFSRNAVILILNYYLALGMDKICNLKSEDVTISNDNITISIPSAQGILHKLNIHDAYLISILKTYFEITKPLIYQTGYFIVSMQSKSKISHSSLGRILKLTSSTSFPLTNTFLKDLRLLHLLKNNVDTYYIQQLFDCTMDILLKRIKYFETHYALHTEIDIIV